MILSGRQFSRCNAFVLAIVSIVCLAMVLQGAHVCPPAASSAGGIQASFSSASPICPVCALAHTLLLTLLLVFFSLGPTRGRMLLVSDRVRPSLRRLRLDLRAPPVF